MPVNGDDTTNTIFWYSDDKETSVTSFGDDTLMTYNVIVLFFLDFGDDRNQNPSDDIPIIALSGRSMNWHVYFFVMIFRQTSLK